MDRDELVEFYFIVPIESLPSVCERGILCNSRAARLRARSIANQDVQDRRRVKRVPKGLRLHDYANLYVNGRNAMLYYLLNQGGRADLCVISVDIAVLDLPDVVVTDRNAAADVARFR
ncbi:MAG TPA: DarT ssDNA thymidine ADP-ribosyltransferase family protein, partial [Gammaproteobacteria bacterium]|nr:DarT ssDNA thymidine ADP-ribosyltransferase family protein [Gammaproteobacteria bacterium]